MSLFGDSFVIAVRSSHVSSSIRSSPSLTVRFFIPPSSGEWVKLGLMVPQGTRQLAEKIIRVATNLYCTVESVSDSSPIYFPASSFLVLSYTVLFTTSDLSPLFKETRYVS